MSLHLIGQTCANCKSRGLVVGCLRPQSDMSLPMALTFQPKGWRLDRLHCFTAVCPKCGVLVSALSSVELRRLQNALKKERLDESMTYHAKRSNKPKNEKRL